MFPTQTGTPPGIPKVSWSWPNFVLAPACITVITCHYHFFIKLTFTIR
jgi:hypothetical protein